MFVRALFVELLKLSLVLKKFQDCKFTRFMYFRFCGGWWPFIGRLFSSRVLYSWSAVCALGGWV